MRTMAIVFVILLALLPTAALADVPGLMNYQGTLTDGDGVALDTTVAMTFRIYTDSTGGSMVWSESQLAVAVGSGMFNVLLGSVNEIADTVFSDPVRWLGIQVGGDPELTPRQRIASVGYAFWSAEADTAQFARNALGGSDGDWTISGSDMYSAVLGDVGIGTSSPASKLDVSGEINTSSLYKIGGSRVLSTTGTQNTFVGVGAGENNISDYGTFVGYNTGYDNQGQHNTFLGRYAGYSNTTGQRNTFVASNAGRENTSGSYNVFVGYEAGRLCSTGVNNVFLGYRAGYYESGSNKLYIDNTLTTSPLVYGEFDNNILAINGDMGIGTTSPDAKLHVEGKAMAGVNSDASGSYAAIGGGHNDTTKALYGGVFSGYSNLAGDEAADTAAFVGGGYDNEATDKFATVGGGYSNTAMGKFSTVAGGGNNSANATSSAIPGGALNTVASSADFSMAFGMGVYINSSQRVVFFDGTVSGRLGLNRDFLDGGISYPIHVGTSTSNGNGAYLTNGGTWTDGSSRTFKENFQPLNGTDLLTKISVIPIEAWQYKDSDERHIGPMAEDFVAAFDVGTMGEDGSRENRYLAARDVAGVALAGVKELSTIIEDLRQHNAELERRIAELERNSE